MLRRLLPQGHVPEFTDPTGTIVIAEIPLAATWIGEPYAEPRPRRRLASRSWSGPVKA